MSISFRDGVRVGTEIYELKDTEEFLAEEINKLSFHERNKAHEDVHCVGEELKEDPDLVEQSQQEFQQELDVIRPKTPIYQTAEEIDADYVNDPKFRLKFIRANEYDAKKAVYQMIKFLQYKEKYFGRDKLCREIDLSDLTEEDREYMKSGAYVVSKHRDRSGRAIVQAMNTKLACSIAPTVIRVSYYVWWNLLIPLEEVQLKGLVGILYDIQRPGDNLQPMKLHDAVEIMSFALALPFRYSSLLCCLKEGNKSSLVNKALLGTITKFFSRYIRVRTRLNFGSDLELRYNLQGVGIPLEDDFVVDTEGTLRQDVVDEWYQLELEKCKKSLEANGSRQRAEFEASMAPKNGNTTSETANNLLPILPYTAPPNHRNPVLMVQPSPAPLTIQPMPQDILFGRGVGCQNHPGNIRFREIAEAYKVQYDNVPRSKRRVIMSTLRNALQVSGSRFLRCNKDGNWEECTAAEVDTKIGQFFRSLRKQNKNKAGKGDGGS